MLRLHFWAALVLLDIFVWPWNIMQEKEEEKKKKKKKKRLSLPTLPDIARWIWKNCRLQIMCHSHFMLVAIKVCRS